MLRIMIFLSLLISISCGLERDPNNNTCPDCHRSDLVIPIVYGLPTKETFAEADSGHVMLGGCMVTDEDPNWYCKRDNTKF